VQDNSVYDFAPATMGEKFLPKKFKADKDYRAAMVEATRLVQRRGVQFDSTYMDIIRSCDEVSEMETRRLIFIH
jgi:hypothetical protein